MNRLRICFLMTVFPMSAVSVSACLWDSETMAAEKARFPEALDIMTGNFPRHSAEFHQWRVAKRREEIRRGGVQPVVYDDLAVSEHKLGNHREAISTMLEKEKIAPGLYETYSNLGTFYIYTEEPDEALKWIGKALEINPEAHFGREKYQRWLVLWAKTPKKPLSGEAESADAGEARKERPVGFARFILEQKKADPETWTSEDRAAALQGILGMMMFADFDNPQLQEALGDVLLSGDWETNSKTSAAFAYRIACTNAKKDSEKQRLFGCFTSATSVLGEKWNPQKLGREVAVMLEKGKVLAVAVRKDEIAWREAGKDLSAEFVRKYLPKKAQP